MFNAFLLIEIFEVNQVLFSNFLTFNVASFEIITTILFFLLLIFILSNVTNQSIVLNHNYFSVHSIFNQAVINLNVNFK